MMLNSGLTYHYTSLIPILCFISWMINWNSSSSAPTKHGYVPSHERFQSPPLETPACMIGSIADTSPGLWQDFAYFPSMILGVLGEEEGICFLFLDEGHGGSGQESEDEGGRLEGKTLGEDGSDQTEAHDSIGKCVD